ncbi:hypothetical protein Pisl_0863 [Pyrobaculum islandicum DSM 4184]|uniref:PaREP12 n=1 Tax=Pyrobaculum islandicum (strain DSM 4184 / JCM 9189 / GEO3) TaxID=384616 RepID=A1RSV7_PYRIL|nr:hypothetical protein Pisl_0863 [Pyrobaculum islandicum DSM 4184]
MRKLGIPPFVVKLKKGDISWIRKRLEEGARLKLAFLGVGRRKGKKKPTYDKLYVAPVFTREVMPVESKAIVVDVNRLDHNIMVGLIVDNKIVKRMRLPDESVIRELRRLIAPNMLLKGIVIMCISQG